MIADVQRVGEVVMTEGRSPLWGDRYVSPNLRDQGSNFRNSSGLLELHL